jgi:N-acetylmuramoyl-L-alanine amidase
LAPPVIVIDAGHGGKDPGAQGTFGKGKKKTIVREKDVVLQISKQLAAALKKKLGAKVSFTRPNDTFITLGERDRIANRRQADLFLSVHANAAKNPDAQGLEIYYLNKATDEASQRLASRENEGAPKQAEDLEEIVSDLLQTAATEESSVLASEVKTSFRKSLVDKYDIERLEVKTALFYVLVGSKCPSLLIETGFVTNPQEGKRLKQIGYQKDMAGAIADAVARYWKSSQEKGDL